MPCALGAICADTLLADSGGGFHIKPVGDIGPGPWDGSGPKDGAFVLRITPNLEGGRPVFDYLGELSLPGDGVLAWSVTDIRGGSAANEGDYAAVDGWLVRDSLHPCASTSRPSGVVYGCPTDDWLTASAYQPIQPDGSMTGPRDAVYLSSGSYDRWAPNPAQLGSGVEPRRATYLMWLVMDGCGPSADCAQGPANLHWRIIDRFDPIPDLPAQRLPTNAPPPVGDTYPGGIPRAVAGEPVLMGLDGQERMASSTDASSFLIGGWFGGGPQICSGGIGPRDPNPIAYHGCAIYQIMGVPGIPYYPPTVVMPVAGSDGPIVLRVHVNDPGAETCWDVATCRTRLVIDDVVWFGDASTSAVPIGPWAAIAQAQRVAFADVRIQPDNSQAYVDEDRFALPIACPAPLPTLTFQLHGDPRMALLSVFPDAGTRKSVQATSDPSVAIACITDGINRVGEPHWIGRDNVLLLVVGDARTATAIEANFGLPPGDASGKRIALPTAALDRSLETIRDYLAARATGERDHAVGNRLIVSQQDGFDAYAEWQSDTMRRHTAGAIDGTITLLSADATEADVGAELWQARPRGARFWLYRVDYPGSTDPTLGSETYVVIHDRNSTFADWQLVRVAGAPYPRIAIPPPIGLPPGVTPIPGNDGSGDTPCVPAGQPCG
jgi:hypothetical protein